MAENEADKPSPDQKPVDPTGKKSDAGPSDPGAPEIVDAEFEDAAPPERAAEKAPASAPGNDADYEDDETPPGAETPKAETSGPRPKRILPGMAVFAAFIAISLAAFAIWRLGGDGPERPAPEEAGPAAPEQAPADRMPRAAEPPPAEGPTTESVEDPPAPAAPDPSKILNTPDADAKEALDTLPPAGEGARGLPPPPPGGSANEDLQRAAKDAVRRIEAERTAEPPEGDEGDAIEVTPPDDAPAIEFRREEAAQPAPEQPRVAAPDEDSARLEEALEQERRRTAELARELDAMRANFERAIEEQGAGAEREIAELEARLARLETGSARPSINPPAASLALMALARAVDAGDPYADQLAAMRSAASGLAIPAALDNGAETGLATAASLKRAFPETARKALAANARERAQGPMGRLFAQFQQVASVRPAQPREGDDPAAVISRAEALLDDDRLSDAARTLDALDGAARDAFAAWRAAAEARIDADQAIGAMNANLLAAYRD